MFRLLSFIIVATFAHGSVSAQIQNENQSEDPEVLAASTAPAADPADATAMTPEDMTGTTSVRSAEAPEGRYYYTPSNMKYSGQNDVAYSGETLIRADGPPTRLRPETESQDA